MKFKLQKINTAPPKTGLKAYQVRIQLFECNPDAEGRILLGASCLSQEDLNEQIERCIAELRKLRFPK